MLMFQMNLVYLAVEQATVATRPGHMIKTKVAFKISITAKFKLKDATLGYVYIHVSALCCNQQSHCTEWAASILK